MAISCNNDINLDEILANPTIYWSGFSLTYLGLPLMIRWLRKINFQLLIDKASKKLSGKQRQNPTRVGHNSLTTVLISPPSTF